MRTSAGSHNAAGNQRFSSIPSANLPRSTFNRSAGNRTTLDSGYLVPIYNEEVLPGDTHRVGMSSFVRMATPIKPVMDNLYFDTFFFFVPLRLLWENFPKFMGEQTNPGDSTDFLTPISTSPGGGYAVGSLQCQLDIPPLVGGLEHTAFNQRAYNLIWNEWFRDENLQDSIPVPTDDGPDDPADFVLRKRGKRHDYFTSCLPFPQKGPAVPLPLGTSAPLVGTINPTSIGDPVFVHQIGALTTGTLSSDLGGNVTGPTDGISTAQLGWSNPNLEVELAQPGVFADLSAATAATVNTIRQAFQLQKLYERDARGGTRYTEIVRSHFGVISPDARLQRPEYLGGGSTRINIHPVSSTIENPTAQTFLGSLGAFVTAGSQNQGFVKSFTEHGVIIGLGMVRADLTYQQGLDRGYSRRTRFDFFWPAFQHLGEQEVLSKEIYADGTAGDDDVFGYQERYAEYRYKPSKISGKFRSIDPQTLDIWHLSQFFANRPLLNDQFIEEDPPIDRVIQIQTEPQFLADFWFSQTSARSMATYSVPGLIDHF